jgi:hypothetical protein
MPTIAPSRAILVGLLIVNGPVLLLLFAPTLTILMIARQPPGLHLLLSLGVGFIAAWTWWSFSVPRWRIWAYERVTDIVKLKSLAVAAGLTWPEGSIFERTEFKSAQLRVREAQLLSSHDAENVPRGQ